MSNRIARPWWLVLMLAIFACPLGGQEGPKAATPGSELAAMPAESADGHANHHTGDRPALRKGNGRYTLEPGDVLDLNFTFTPDFNQSVTIGPDGYITLRNLGDLRVEGQTTQQVAQTLESLYAKVLQDPVVTVELKDFEKPYFIVGGEVEHPGKFELRGKTTLTQAVAIAGGFRDSAKHSQVLLFHRVSDDWAAVTQINVKKMLRAGNLSEDPELQPGDMLFVPKNTLSKIKPFIPVPGLGAYFNPTRF